MGLIFYIAVVVVMGIAVEMPILIEVLITCARRRDVKMYCDIVLNGM